jgi:hypothetical protein
MKLICTPETNTIAINDDVLQLVLYGQPHHQGQASAGAAIKRLIEREKLQPASRAWDLVSLALSVITADLASHRNKSPDGWTREFNIEIAVADADFWNSQHENIEKMLAFLTTDLWKIHFIPGGFQPIPITQPIFPLEDSIVLLSGGLDSLIGTIDLIASGKKPFIVSQLVRGDTNKQKGFAEKIGKGVRHIIFNHNVRVPNPEASPTQRSRSLIFLSYGILIATTLAKYNQTNQVIPLYICENGFISINPPLTGGRLGSLSTRTTHPIFLQGLQQILDAAGLRIKLENPYQFKTKGEMLIDCVDQNLLRGLASSSTSCGRFKRYGYKHCGRCLPCQIRRAAFQVWGVEDTTQYVFTDLGHNDKEHAGFDDVRSVAMAIAEMQDGNFDSWLGGTLSSALVAHNAQLKDVVYRGLHELAYLHQAYGVT